MDGEDTYDDSLDDRENELDLASEIGHTEEEENENSEKQQYIEEFWRAHNNGWAYSDDD